MSHYRRASTPGATYFFTVITYKRQNILCQKPIREALRKAITDTREKYPFKIDAWVLLPDHLHCIWTLPKNDHDFSVRWNLIKRRVSRVCKNKYGEQSLQSPSKQKHRESTLWQRRFWEHRIRDRKDMNCHLDYIHFNPVKHGHCKQTSEWPYSSIHRYIKAGKYPENWASKTPITNGNCFGE